VVENGFASVAEGRVAKVVGETGGFDEVGVDKVVGAEIVCVVRLGVVVKKVVADGATDLCNFEGVGEAGAVEVVFTGPEDLGLRLKAAKSGGMEDAVAVDLKGAAVIGGGFGTSRKAGEIVAVIELIVHRRL